MEQVSSPNEILDFAISREIEANRFYLELARRMADSKMAQVFEDFAREELDHKAKLEAVKAGELVIEPDEVGSLGIADYVMGDDAWPQMSYANVLILAMNKEKKSYRLYFDLAARVKDTKLKDMFLRLAQEEANHKLRFELEYDLTTF
jgi:rubrerythrin